VAQVLLEREDGKKVTLEAFRNKDISGGTSSYEVVHQVVPDSSRVDRGDVSLLINGLPIIHIELKKESLKTVLCKLIIKFSVMQKMDFLKGFTQLLKSW
jgi:type I restriction enzyme R subunit